MNSSKWDIMKLALTFEGEFCLADYSPEEIEEMLGLDSRRVYSVEEIRARYFEYYDDVKDRTLEKHKWSD